MFSPKKMSFFYLTMIFISFLLTPPFFLPHASAQPTNPFLGKWGYTVLGHSAGTGAWYTWKTEAGTIEFFVNGTAVATYKESADTCTDSDSNYCKATDTTNHTYTYDPSTRTAILDGAVKLYISDDGSVAIGDGTSLSGELIFVVAVKLNTSYQYSSNDVTGAYYTGAYEYDSLGNPPPNGLGKYRLWAITANAQSGVFNLTGNLNSDGNVFGLPQAQTQPFQVNPDGSMQVGTEATGFSTGYIGSGGKITIFSNPTGGVETDFASFIALKKQDRTYAQSDVTGTWAFTTFGDYNGNEFRTEFGILTCDNSGQCSVFMKKKTSNGTTTTFSSNVTLTAAQDGSINGFLLTQATPHFSGAIGNNGNTMIILMNTSSSHTNDRGLAIAVKRNTANTNTITVSGKVQDPNGNFTSGIKVELAEDPTVFTYTNSLGEYTLGVPKGVDFTLRFTKDGAIPTYSPIFNFNTDTTISRHFRLFATGWNANIGNFPIINGRVRENSQNWETVTLSGVNVTSSSGTVEYTTDGTSFGGTSTFANGLWFIRNASPGDTITVSATKVGTIIPARKYKAFSDGVTSGSLFATPDQGTIWVSRIVSTRTGQPVANAAVAKVINDTTGATGTPSTTTNTDGSFTLAGLPSGSPFYLKTTKEGFVPDYTLYNSTSNYNMLTGRPISLWTQQDMTGAGVSTGKGIIKGVVINDNDPNEPPVEGVTITYTSSKGNTYEVKYFNPSTNSYESATATFANGNFFIINVEEGDNVTVNATKSGWSFSPRTYITHGDSTVSALIRGTQSTGAEEQAIRDGFASAIQAFNSKNIDVFMSYVSDSYLNEGQNKTQWREELAAYFSSPDFQQLAYTINSVSISGDRATVNFTWTSGPDAGRQDTVYFIKENNTWRLYGNQEKYHVWAGSGHWDKDLSGNPSNKYYANLGVLDPEHKITQVSVSGPGITNQFNMTYHTDTKSWWSDTGTPDFGTQPPSNATYIFTITDAQGTYTYTRVINGGVAQFASNLSPSGNVSGPITFTFTGIPNVQEYRIELYSESGQRIWHSDHTSSTTIAYTGPPLQSGTYRYYVASQIGENQSFAYGTFTYTGGGGVSTISFTGRVVDIEENPVQGATVMKAGAPSISTSTNINGDFILNGLPSGSPFHIKITKDGFIPVYSAVFNTTTNFTALRPFKLFTQQELTSRGWPSTVSMINGVVARQDNPQMTLSGATVTATGQSGASYPVTYETEQGLFGGTSTSSNGRYYIFNITPGDTVTVTANLAGYTFNQRVFTVHNDGMSQGSLFGTPSGGTGGITSIPLSSGWNFISFPKLPSTSTSIETALANVLNNVRVVWGYDNQTKTWKRYRPNDAQNNTLSTVETGKGYWIYLNSGGTIDLTNWSVSSSTISLTKGWNLIGFSGTDGTSVSTALSNISGSWEVIWTWQNGEWFIYPQIQAPISAINVMNQGRAYWIKMKEDKNWQQP